MIIVRTSWALVAALLVTTASPRSIWGYEPQPDAPQYVPARVGVDASAMEDDLQKLIEDAIADGIREQLAEQFHVPVAKGGPQGVAQVGVALSWQDADTLTWSIAIRVEREGTTKRLDPFTCDRCASHEEVLPRIVQELPAVVELLEVAPAEEPDPPDDSATPQGGGDKPKAIGALGYAGIGLGVAGLAGLGVGAWLATRDPSLDGESGADNAGLHDVRPGGWAALALGSAGVVAGVVMIAVDVGKRRRARVAVVPTAGGLVVRGRF
jgi:hypothetical protein